MDINEIIAKDRTASSIIADLKKKSINVPSWAVLRKEYNPKEHPINTEQEFQDRESGREVRTRITFAWQRLAAARMGELLFALPVKYITRAQNDNEKRAAKIIKSVLKKNRIDSVNLERARMLYAGCEVMTIWFPQEMPTEYGNESSDYKLRCRNFSPMKGDALYPLFDEYDDLIALSVEYQRQEEQQTITYFDCYTDTEHIRWRSTGGELTEEMREKVTIGKICGIYGWRQSPIWEDKSNNVYEAERAVSRNGNYLRRNSKPTWVEYTEKGRRYGKEEKDIKADRNIIRLGANDKAGYATWEQSTESLKFQVEEIKRNFFMDLQLPDMSMDNLKATPMSGEARKMMFIDANLKAGDEQGIWLEYLSREINVLRAYLKGIYPDLAAAFDSLDIDIKINPYQINDSKEQADVLATATGGKAFMSQRTAVQELGVVDDEEQEMEEIAADEQQSTYDLTNMPSE